MANCEYDDKKRRMSIDKGFCATLLFFSIFIPTELVLYKAKPPVYCTKCIFNTELLTYLRSQFNNMKINVCIAFCILYRETQREQRTPYLLY